MRLAICHPYVQPKRGGCETYIADLTRRLIADGHQVSIYACDCDLAMLPKTIQLRALPEPGWPRLLRPWRFSELCRKALERDQPDLSIGFDKIRGVDVLYPQGGLHVACIDHGVLRFRSRTMRSLAHAFRTLDPSHYSFARFERVQFRGDPLPTLIVNSNMVKRHCETYYAVPPERVTVLHAAVDPARFTAIDRPARRAAVRDRWNIAPDETLALFVATNYKLKGLDALLRALPFAPQLRLLVVGSPDIAGYQRLARQLRVTDQVLFFGGFHADPRDLFFAADLFVHPTFYDPCSLVVLEARSCGLPVITTRYNGAAELLDPPHDGIVLDDPHQTREFGAALRCLLDPVRRRRAAAAALANSQQWTWDHHYRSLIRILTGALEAKRLASRAASRRPSAASRRP